MIRTKDIIIVEVISKLLAMQVDLQTGVQLYDFIQNHMQVQSMCMH